MCNDEIQRDTYVSAISRNFHSKGRIDSVSIKKFKIAFVIVVVLIALFFIAQLLSFQLAMIVNGFSPTPKRTFAPVGSEDLNGRNFTVVYTTTANGDHALVHLGKNELGFWTVLQSSVLTDEYPHRTLTWSTLGDQQSIRNTSIEDNFAGEPLSVNFEKHALFIGNNARRKITFSKLNTPDGYYFRVYQNDSFYIIEAITQSDEFSSSIIYDAFRFCLSPAN